MSGVVLYFQKQRMNTKKHEQKVWKMQETNRKSEEMHNAEGDTTN